MKKDDVMLLKKISKGESLPPQDLACLKLRLGSSPEIPRSSIGYVDDLGKGVTSMDAASQLLEKLGML